MRKVLAVVAVMAVATFALAQDPQHQYVIVDNSEGGLPANYFTVDLQIMPAQGDEWTSTGGDATLDGADTFYQDALGDKGPQSKALRDLFPSLKFDSFWTGPEYFPNFDVDGGPSFAEFSEAPQLLHAVWFDTPPNTGPDGWQTIARYTVIHDNPDVSYLILEGNSTTVNGGGDLYPYSFEVPIPEPATLTLLGLGLALIRRR